MTTVDEEQTQEQPPESAHQRSMLPLVLAVLGVVALLAAGAFVATRSDRSGGREDWAGTVLSVEQSKPEIALTDTAGERFDLAEATDGQLTLLMFGYTNCPDICPISVATLASALDSMDPAVARKVRLVFVAADPERDTPERLRSFLDQFDERFIGLTGTLEELDAAQDAANVPIAVRDEPDEDGSYAVGHATQMIAYQSDGVARIVYPFGTRESDWVRDLPRLVAGEEPVL